MYNKSQFNDQQLESAVQYLLPSSVVADAALLNEDPRPLLTETYV